jgi:hypothetical protein
MARSEAWRDAARSRYWREAEARVVVEAWRRSGETLVGFCRANGVASARVSRWLARLDRPPAVPFHPVRLTQEVTARAEIEVEVPGGVTVRLAPGFDAEEFRRVLAVLGVGPGC